MMLFLRSLLFNVAFYVGTAVLMVAGLPALARDRHAVLRVARRWGRFSEWLLRVVCRTRVEYRGLENIPTGGYIIAPKHQSVWETFALLRFPPDFSFILKRELLSIPLFGWYLKGAEQIAIDRSQGGPALAQVVAQSRVLLAEGRQVFIFPEGTRRPVGAEPRYKFGVAQIYAETGAPCLPIALNSGLFWPRRSFLRRPGVILVQFLEPIQPGLDRAAFFALLQSRLEQASNALIAESIAADPSLRPAIEANSGPTDTPASRRADHEASS